MSQVNPAELAYGSDKTGLVWGYLFKPGQYTNLDVNLGYYTQAIGLGQMPDDVVITKQRASVFFGTPLMAHLTQLGVQSLIICGESTSGCVRASAVDAYSNGFHVVLVEECCFDRSLLSHKVNLFDMHHKYADVMHVGEVIAHLEALAAKKVKKAS